MTTTTNDLVEHLVESLECDDDIAERASPARRASRRKVPDEHSPTTRLRALARTIEGEIVPRLLLARTAGAAIEASERRESAASGHEITASDVDELVRLLLLHDSTVASAYAMTFHQRGAPLEVVCLELLAPAARRLGELWTADRADVIQVTLGLCRLQTLLRDFSVAHRGEVDGRVQGASALLVPAAGEQHTFGLQLVAEFFRRAHWDVWATYPTSDEELLELVARERFALIGFTLSCESRLPALTKRIKATRQASRNKSARILVGGRVFNEHPDFVARVGADGSAVDARQAALAGANLLGTIGTA